MDKFEIIYSVAYIKLRSRLVIDMLRFDEEIMALPQLIQEAAELAADAGVERDSSKQARDIALAEAANVLRNVEGKPPSEKQIDSEVNLVDSVQDAVQTYIKASRDAEVWRSLVESLKNKKELLRTLSDQIIAGFMSPTSFVKDARQAMNEVRQATGGVPRRKVPE